MVIGFTCSCFDLFHPGHLFMLEEAKTKCDKLWVGLQVDPSRDRPEKNKPVQSFFERWIQVQANKNVDRIIPYETEADLINILLSFDIDIRIIGDEYKDKNFTGKTECEEKGIEIYYNKRFHSYSSTELRGRLSRTKCEKETTIE